MTTEQAIATLLPITSPPPQGPQAPLEVVPDFFPRWAVIITYRSAVHGHLKHLEYVEELEEVAELVERGPHWDTIVDVRIARNFQDGENAALTVEESLEL